ncbi:MAG: NblA-related protein [Oscillatoria sp. SIO1A7]|nr:NblA-related protein [Oscillatoria sp. SIO1A7]
MSEPIEFSLEQQFSIRAFESQVDQMNLDQAKHFLKETYKQMMMRETMYQHFLKQHWGLESSPSLD